MEPPGKVIRSLREALNMSQAEFARAAGWSPSTISSWERGKATPSRLAFKTILAFAEERGVRYQTPGDGSRRDAPAQPMLPSLRLSSRLPSLPPVAALDADRGAESSGSRRWTAVAGEGLAADAERTAWRAEASFRLTVGARSDTRKRTGYVAAAAALALGVGVGALLHTSTGSAPVRPLQSARDVDRAPDVAAEEPAVPWGERVGFPAMAAVAEPSLEPVVPAEPAVQLARLESIVALDGIRRASFRVGDRSITLVEGDQLGAQAIAEIANDEVRLVNGGISTRVRLGFETPVE